VYRDGRSANPSSEDECLRWERDAEDDSLYRLFDRVAEGGTAAQRILQKFKQRCLAAADRSDYRRDCAREPIDRAVARGLYGEVFEADPSCHIACLCGRSTTSGSSL